MVMLAADADAVSGRRIDVRQSATSLGNTRRSTQVIVSGREITKPFWEDPRHRTMRGKGQVQHPVSRPILFGMRAWLSRGIPPAPITTRFVRPESSQREARANCT